MPSPILGCSPIESYRILDKLGEGTFGQVHRAVHVETGTAVALKEILLHNKEDGMPITALREIRILKSLRHENVLELLDMAVKHGKREERRRASFSMVTPYMDHDLAGLLQNDKVKLTIPHIKCYMGQLLEGINYLHQSHYMHRDIKAANILVDNRGNVKIADFGLARKYLDPVPTIAGASPASTRYTATVVTRWYRPPELLLGEQFYTTAIDIWGIGCIFGEIFVRKPIFPGRSDHDQISIVFQMMGAPDDVKMPGFSKLPGAHLAPRAPLSRKFENTFSNIPAPARDLLEKLLDINPLTRLSALGALAHPFFSTGPPPCAKAELPIYTSSHELDARRKQSHRQSGPGLPNRPDRVPNDRWQQNQNRPKPRKGGAFSYKIPHRQALNGINLVPPYRRTKQKPSDGPEPPLEKPRSQQLPVLDY